MRSLGWGPNSIGLVCPHKKRKRLQEHKYSREKASKIQQKPAICRLRSEASGETNHADTSSWTSGLQNFEKVHFYCLSHPGHGILFLQP